jgi:hypothetical protein
MLNTYHQENLFKINQTANLLVQDLCNPMKSADRLLVEITHGILQHDLQLEQRLKRLASITRSEEKAE